MIGAVGSSGKNGCALLVSGTTAAAAAEAYCLRSAVDAILETLCVLMYDGRAQRAVRRSEAMVIVGRCCRVERERESHDSYRELECGECVTAPSFASIVVH
jgi:hypothetical protein